MLIRQYGHVENGGVVNASEHFNLDLLSRYLDLPLVEWSDLKPAGRWYENTTLGTPQVVEHFRPSRCARPALRIAACFVNIYTGSQSADAYGLDVKFWPSPSPALCLRSDARSGDEGSRRGWRRCASTVLDRLADACQIANNFNYERCV